MSDEAEFDDHEWDEVKSDLNLQERGYDYELAAGVFAGPSVHRANRCTKALRRSSVRGDRGGRRFHHSGRMDAARQKPPYHLVSAGKAPRGIKVSCLSENNKARAWRLKAVSTQPRCVPQRRPIRLGGMSKTASTIATSAPSVLSFRRPMCAHCASGSHFRKRRSASAIFCRCARSKIGNNAGENRPNLLVSFSTQSTAMPRRSRPS